MAEPVFIAGHALLIGVGTYKNSPRLNVPIAAEDAGAVAAVLEDANYCGYPKGQINLLRNELATKQGLLDALDQLAQTIEPTDTAFLFYCGHGHYGTDGNYYLISHDAEIDKKARKVVAGTGVSELEFLDKLRQIKAERLLLVVNACHSGEISPSLDIGEEPSPESEMLPSQLRTALLGTGRGRIIITACGEEDQKSWIGKGQLSIFTQALVDGLQGKGEIINRNGFISAFDLYTHIYETVSEKVEKLLGLRQEPELTVTKGVGPFAVSLFRGATSLGGFDESAPLPEAGKVHAVKPEKVVQRFKQMVQVINQSGGVNFGQGNRINIGGDVVAGDKIGGDKVGGDKIVTGGGAYVGGSVNVSHGDFVGRDKTLAQTTTGATLAEFTQLLAQLRDEVEKSNLDEEDTEAVKTDLNLVEQMAAKEQPKGSSILNRLNSVKDVVEAATGLGTASANLAPVVHKLFDFARQLFG